MDKLDVRIVRELLQGEPSLSLWPERATAKPALAFLSRKLRVAESTVRKRYERLSGFVSGWSLMVNPSLLGVKWGALWLQVPANISKRDALEKLALMDDVLVIVNYASRCIACVFLYPDGTRIETKAKQIQRLLDCVESLWTDIPVPPCEAELSRSDARIILSRGADLTKSNRDVAEELGVSSRTIKRRLLRLVEARAVWPQATLNVGALEGRVYADLLLECRDPDARTATEAEILGLVDDYLFFHARFVGLSQFSLMLPGVPAAGTLLDRVTRLGGVRMARFDFVEEWIESYGRVGERLQRMMARRTAG